MKYFRDRLAMIQSLPPETTGVEVGVQTGDFSRKILSTPVAQLHLVDPWAKIDDPSYAGDPANVSQFKHDENYRKVVCEFGNDPRITIHRQTSLDAAADWVGIVDWVYIDANHSYHHVGQDLRMWRNNVKVGGYLMGHDFIDNGWTRMAGFGVVKAVEEFCRSFGWEIEALTTCGWSSYRLVRALP